jgi:hypothetical protein
MANTDIFVKETDELKVSVFATKSDEGQVRAASDMDTLKEVHPELTDETGVTEYKFVFRQPTFKDSISVGQDLFQANEDGVGMAFNPLATRYSKMVKLMKDWNITGDDDKKVPVNEENISKLHPNVANVAGIQLDQMTPDF